MSKTVTIIGPDDDGRRMTLDEFEYADAVEGYLYELSRGVVTVVDVPQDRHFAQVDAIRQQFSEYRAKHPQRIHRIGAGSDCKVLISSLESERHPDVAIYTVPKPDEEDFWATWIPDIVIEVVSPSSVQRDYVEKREEYLLFGVREYWIVDADKQEVLILRRSRGAWTERVIRPPEVYRTGLLRGFDFDCAAVFAAAASA